MEFIAFQFFSHVSNLRSKFSGDTFSARVFSKLPQEPRALEEYVIWIFQDSIIIIQNPCLNFDNLGCKYRFSRRRPSLIVVVWVRLWRQEVLWLEPWIRSADKRQVRFLIWFLLNGKSGGCESRLKFSIDESRIPRSLEFDLLWFLFSKQLATKAFFNEGSGSI